MGDTGEAVICCTESPKHWHVTGPAGAVSIPRDGRWTFSGDYERPTFSPSVNETWGKEGKRGARRASHMRILRLTPLLIGTIASSGTDGSSTWAIAHTPTPARPMT